jgi:arginyl-tRNA synthetase
MVNLPEGKMKSREGNVVDADNLLDLLYDMALEAVNEKKIIEDEKGKTETARRVSLAALKYYLLNFSTIKDITFSPEKSISFDGNTGPYLQYTTARIYSLLRKAGTFDSSVEGYSLLPDEWNLTAMLMDFEEVVEKACENVSPVDLTTYLYELCRLYNKYYHDVPINVDQPLEKNARLYLSQSVLTVLVNGLKLLGIDPLERM